MFENQRRFARVPLSADIAVRMKGQLLGGSVCTNISLGGMSIVFHDSVEEGSSGKIWLTQNYPDESIVLEADFHKLWVKAITLDNGQKRMGVQFGELHPRQRDNLWRIVRRQLSQAKQIS